MNITFEYILDFGVLGEQDCWVDCDVTEHDGSYETTIKSITSLGINGDITPRLNSDMQFDMVDACIAAYEGKVVRL